MGIHAVISEAWYRPRSWILLLLPLAWLFCGLVALRRRWLQARFQSKPYTVPVIVVGNIVVGGSGKTPFIIGLVKALQGAGLRPGVVSRGYGGRATAYPLPVTPKSSPQEAGDEPVLIAQSCGCPLVVDPDRVRAVEALIAQGDCDLIISDDGLQHYRLHRDLEIAVIDGERGLGNGQCLPAGPLREPPSRLRQVDWVVIQGSESGALGPGLAKPIKMTLVPTIFRHLADGACRALNEWPKAVKVHAVAGIGNPARFAATLSALGMKPDLHAFPDHHHYRPWDIEFNDGLPVILTAKDAVKCTGFAKPGVWALHVEARIDGMEPLIQTLLNPKLRTQNPEPRPKGAPL